MHEGYCAPGRISEEAFAFVNLVMPKDDLVCITQIEEDTDRDRYMSPLEAKNYGLIDEVIGGDEAGFQISGTTRDFPKTKEAYVNWVSVSSLLPWTYLHPQGCVGVPVWPKSHVAEIQGYSEGLCDAIMFTGNLQDKYKHRVHQTIVLDIPDLAQLCVSALSMGSESCWCIMRRVTSMRMVTEEADSEANHLSHTPRPWLMNEVTGVCHLVPACCCVQTLC